MKNEIPGYEMISGAAIAFGALLLIIPGFATDILGFFLLIPLTRKIFFGRFFKKIKKNNNKNKDYIEGQFEDIDEDDDRKI